MTFRAVSVFGGGGLLDEAAAQAGFHSAATIEHNKKSADVWALNHNGHVFCSSVEQVSHEDMSLFARIGDAIGLLTMGIPCEPFSKIRRVQKDGKTKRTGVGWLDHELADMFYWGLRAVEGFNPHTVIVEEVPGFLDTEASRLMTHVLHRMGYPTIESAIINPADHASMTGRKRAVMVATMHDAVNWPRHSVSTGTVGDLLLPADDPGLKWFNREDPNKQWLFNHWAKNDAKGSGFTPEIIYGGEDRLPTIKKRYWAGQGDNFVIGHPDIPNTYRWLTIDEGKRFMGLRDDYDLGPTKTTAGEIIGQGVEVGTFTKIIQSVCRV